MASIVLTRTLCLDVSKKNVYELTACVAVERITATRRVASIYDIQCDSDRHRPRSAHR